MYNLDIISAGCLLMKVINFKSKKIDALHFIFCRMVRATRYKCGEIKKKLNERK